MQRAGQDGTGAETGPEDMSEHFLAAEEQRKKAAALLAPCEHSISAGHRWVLEGVLPSQQGQGELGAVVCAQCMLQITAKRLQGCPSCGVQCLCTASLCPATAVERVISWGRQGCQEPPELRRSIKVLPLGLIALMCNVDVQKWSNHQQPLKRANR